MKNPDQLVPPFASPLIFSWWWKAGARWIEPPRDKATFSALLIEMEQKFKSPRKCQMVRFIDPELKMLAWLPLQSLHKQSFGNVIFKLSIFNGTKKWPLRAGSPNAVLSYLHCCHCAVIFSWLHISSFSFVSSSLLCHTIKRKRGAWHPSVHRAGVVTV